MLLSKMNYIIFKLTDSCNLKCSYCSAQALGVWEGNSMPMPTFKKTTDFFVEHSTQPMLNFVFHGGEPLIIPTPWLREAMDYAIAKASAHGKRMVFSMQTNGTVFSQKIVDLIKEYKIGVSTSLDGTPEINNQLRQKGERVVDNIGKFREAGIDLAVITLVNKNNFNKFPLIIDYFLENGITAVKVNPYYTVGHGNGMQPITSAELFQAKRDFLDHMIETRMEKAVDVNLVHEIMNYATRRQNRQSTLPTCRDKFCAGGITMAGVTPEGDVFPCVRSVGLNEEWLLWNIHRGIEEQQYKKRLNEFHAKDLHYMGCENCEASRICTHGCTAFAKSSIEGDLLECLYTKAMFKYFEERRQDIYGLYELIVHRRRQRSQPATPSEPAKGSRPVTPGIPAVVATAMGALAKELAGLEETVHLELIGKQGPLMLYQFEGQKFMYHTETRSLSRIDDLAFRIITHFERAGTDSFQQELAAQFPRSDYRSVMNQVATLIGQSLPQGMAESLHLA